MRVARGAVLVVALASVAHGEGKAIVVESHSASRPPAMARYVAETVAILGLTSGAGESLRVRLEASIARPRTRPALEDLQALERRVSEGANAYNEANFTVAVAALTQAADGLAQESFTLAAEPRLREARKIALITLAQAFVKTRRFDEARDTLGEVVRSYPEVVFSEAVYPPKVVELSRAVLRAKAAAPGRLVVETSPPGRKIVLNETSLGPSPKVQGGLLPGAYRLYIAGATGGRGTVRKVEIAAGQTVSLQIALDVDDHLETQEYVGLRFSGAAERLRAEVPLACALARAVGADEVYILARQTSPSAEAELLGAVYDAHSGHRKWGVILPLSPGPDDAALSRFALSLKTRRAVDGVRLAEGPGPLRFPERVEIFRTFPEKPKPPLPAWPGWVVAGLGLAGVALGVGDVLLDGQGTCAPTVPGGQCPTTYTTGRQGLGFLVAGAVIAVGGTAWAATLTARRRH